MICKGNLKVTIIQMLGKLSGLLLLIRRDS